MRIFQKAEHQSIKMLGKELLQVAASNFSIYETFSIIF